VFLGIRDFDFDSVYVLPFGKSSNLK